MIKKKKWKEDWQSVAERDVSRDIVEVFRVVLLDMLIILLLIESASAAANLYQLIRIEKRKKNCCLSWLEDQKIVLNMLLWGARVVFP